MVADYSHPIPYSSDLIISEDKGTRKSEDYFMYGLETSAYPINLAKEIKNARFPGHAYHY